ncbi:MAG TPA: hypothetical protein VER39_09605 [Nocardioidaceae bacterium]|nr:hypothetical protein [Nocardioidaceae bacterium]
MWIWIVVAALIVSLALVWWRDRRHHGAVDQRRINDGITRNWTDAESLSRRDTYRHDKRRHD